MKKREQKPASPANPTTKDLPITPAQAELLARLNADMQHAQSRFDAAVSAVVGGHDVAASAVAGVVVVAGKPMLRVIVSDTGTAS